jgi:hypothetical protein
MRSSVVRPVQDTCKQLLHPSQFIEGKPPIDLSQLAQALIYLVDIEFELRGKEKRKKKENNLTPDWYFETGVTPHNFISLLQSQNFSPLLTT